MQFFKNVAILKNCCNFLKNVAIIEKCCNNRKMLQFLKNLAIFKKMLHFMKNVAIFEKCCSFRKMLQFLKNVEKNKKIVVHGISHFDITGEIWYQPLAISMINYNPRRILYSYWLFWRSIWIFIGPKNYILTEAKPKSICDFERQ